MFLQRRNYFIFEEYIFYNHFIFLFLQVYYEYILF